MSTTTNEVIFTEATTSQINPSFNNTNKTIEETYSKVTEQNNNAVNNTVQAVISSSNANNTLEDLQRSMMSTNGYQRMILGGLIDNNNNIHSKNNTLRRQYQIQKYEEMKNIDRNRIMNNLAIVLLILLISTIIYKMNIISLSSLTLIFIVGSIFIGLYLSYQYYYDYYIRDKIFYNQIYKTMEENDDNNNKCPINNTQTYV